jgi:hypothetical protein
VDDQGRGGDPGQVEIAAFEQRKENQPELVVGCEAGRA